jgi:EAL domain-containing protein (putative c-di-GMP-specific phosphodiesterase class I)
MSCAMGVSLAARSRFGYWAFRLFDPAMHNRAVHRLRLEADLRTALNRNQFRVLYQPMLRISPRELIGFEALLRWHTEHTVEMFTQMKRVGVVTAIDDFGNSDFSLASLRRFGCELLKIDRALITNMQADRTSHDVVELILAMACMLHCEVIAEGVEKAAQLDEPWLHGLQLGPGILFLLSTRPSSRPAIVTKGTNCFRLTFLNRRRRPDLAPPQQKWI